MTTTVTKDEDPMGVAHVLGLPVAPAKRETPVCKYCNSDEIVCDAVARWDKDQQAWVLADVHESTYCSSCDNESKYPKWTKEA